jgi:hypothetical protein
LPYHLPQMENLELLDDEYRIIDEFTVARLLNIKVGNVRGLRRRGLGPEWFRVDGRSPRYTVGSVKRYIEQLKESRAVPEMAV